MKKPTVAFQGFEKGDKVSHNRHCLFGEIIEVAGGQHGYILVRWENNVMAYYGLGEYRNNISDISLLV